MGENEKRPGPLDDSSRHVIAAGDFEAVFLPGYGMLCASFRHRGEELLRCIDGLDDLAATGRAAGIPFLHPWANRLAGPHYRAGGRDVSFDPASPLLHHDENGVIIHGVPWSRLPWRVTESRREGVSAQLEWDREDLLALFPFPHRLLMDVVLGPDGLRVALTLTTGPDGPVPVSFGFHPYFGLPGVPRSDWRLTLPPLEKILVDSRGIPTGEKEPFDGYDAPLAARSVDAGGALGEGPHSFSLAGGGRRVTVDFLEGYPYAQVFAPLGKDYVALEPMTAPTNALTTGEGLRLVDPNDSFRAVFQVRVETGVSI
jgi:aldose 1-epimerase